MAREKRPYLTIKKEGRCRKMKGYRLNPGETLEFRGDYSLPAMKITNYSANQTIWVGWRKE